MPQDEPQPLTEDSLQVPSTSPDHQADDDPLQNDRDLQDARAAWEGEPRFEQPDRELSEEALQRAAELAEPFVGRWNSLISTTNWEKGRIISEWRSQLIDSGVDATQYSDEAWSRRVGGVTSPHVGRLRRVYNRFGETYDSYPGLYWSHFLAALDWEDAPMWLEGAVRENWSISAMREQRWQAEGALADQRPTDAQIVAADTDEDITLPAQGGGSNREYNNEEGAVAAGPAYEAPDFGDEDELASMAPSGTRGEGEADAGETPDGEANPIQPFIGLPELPEDLTDAIEALKLALLRHKTTKWQTVKMETVQRYLDAIGIMIRNG